MIFASVIGFNNFRDGLLLTGIVWTVEVDDNFLEAIGMMMKYQALQHSGRDSPGAPGHNTRRAQLGENTTLHTLNTRPLNAVYIIEPSELGE